VVVVSARLVFVVAAGTQVIPIVWLTMVALDLWPGSWTFCRLQSLFQLVARVGGLRRLAQSYVGKRPISKGFGRAIPTFITTYPSWISEVLRQIRFRITSLFVAFHDVGPEERHQKRTTVPAMNPKHPHFWPAVLS
jgi:hypothetical protein